ncbi:MAG: hypothetical protein COB02_02320 [Candidatus Cloacimonadota bacterium]|nr:MAG: hypothetical protein COB02_02320 [Candidatus Cloacimonadota bacterium]
MKRLSLIGLSLFAISNQIQFTTIDNNVYLNEIVISATKTNTSLKNLGHSIKVITQKQIQESGFHQLTDLLKTIPSLFITSNGGLGSSSSLFLRGSNSEFTLFLIDGVRFHDNSSPAKGSVIQHISLDNVEKIEILKGGQSSIWGSDAMAGVINIITKKGNKIDSGEAYIEYGSFSTLKSQISFFGGNDFANYYLGVNYTDSDGFSSKSKKRGFIEDDGYESLNIDLKLDFKGKSDQNTSIIIKRNESEKDYDGFSSEFGFISEATQTIFALSHDKIGGNGIYEEKYQYSLARVDRNELNTNSLPAEYKSKDQNLSYIRSYFLDKHTLSLGLEHLNSSAQNAFSTFKINSNKIQSIFLNDLIEISKSFNLQVGVRKDNISDFGSHSTYRISPSYLHNKIRLFSSISTAFKAPSLYQLYNGTGNDGLKPIESKSFDFGIDYQINNKTTFGLTKFKTDYNNLIQFVSFTAGTAKYQNLSQVDTFGYEAYIRSKLSNKSNLQYSYNRTTSIDKATNLSLLRRPVQKHNISLDHHFDKKNKLNLTYMIVGARDDKNFNLFPAKRLKLDSYKVLHLNFQKELSKEFLLSLRLENLLNENYEELYEFGTSKRAIYLGLKTKF